MTATDGEPMILDQNGRPLAVRKPATLPQSDLLAVAIDKGMDADGIAKLVDLIERRERQQAERDFTEALSFVSEKAGVIVKSKKGSKANYAPLDEINHLITPIYTAAGLSLSFSEADCPFADRGWRRHVCDVRHKGGHKERYHVDLPLEEPIVSREGKVAMTPIQAAISTGSYAQRVLISRIFNLTIASTDLDGANGQSAGITEPEILELKNLIADYEQLVNPIDMERFLEWVGAKSLESFTVKQFEMAKGDLTRKIAAAKKSGLKK